MSLARIGVLRRSCVKNWFFQCKSEVHLSAAHSALTNLKQKELHRDPEWDNAKPYESIPGPNSFLQQLEFFPGGKYYNIPMKELFEKFRADFGEIVLLKGHLNRSDVVFVWDPNDFEKVFRTEGIWPVRNGMETFTYFRRHVRPELFTNTGGLVAEQGQQWADLRSKVNPVMLKPKNLNRYIQPIDEIAQQLIAKAKTLRDHNQEVPKNFDTVVKKWAFETIAVIAMDSRLGLLDDNSTDEVGKKFPGLVRDFFEYSYQLEILPSLWRVIPTPTFNKQMKTLNTLTDNILIYVDRAMKRIEGEPLNSRKDEDLSMLEQLLKIDRGAALVMAGDMLLAGVDTTTTFVTGLLYNLAKCPNEQEILREEIMKILPKKDSPLTHVQLNNLPYLKACMKEANRLHPVANGNFRATGIDLVLKGHQIPKGTDISMGAVLSHYSNEVFPECEKFVPERWLGTETEGPAAKTAHPFVYLPFGFGARTCAGRRLAEMEVKILVARMVRNFKLEFHNKPLTTMGRFINVLEGDLNFRLIDLDK